MVNCSSLCDTTAMQNDIMSHWDSYYQTEADFIYIHQPGLDRLLKHLDHALPKHCLDIGCGTGQLSRELFHRGFSVIGVDASDKAIQIAQNASVYTARGLEYYHLDFENEVVPTSDTFSMITCKLVYAFITNKPAFLQKVATLLRENGVFVIITPTKEHVPPEETNIAVEVGETLAELQQHFTVSQYEFRKLTYFICKQ